MGGSLLVPTVRSRVGRSRRAAEVLVTGVATVLVAGVLLGTGFAQTVLAATDGLSWLGDETRGEVIQINPTTGRPEVRLTIAPAGHRLHVAQNDTLLVVTDINSGIVTIIDPATLADTGTWTGTPERTKVLLAGAELYVVDRAIGSIARLNPATGSPIGPRWTAGAPLADAAIDATTTLWALDARGRLNRLQWTPDGLSDVTPPRRIAGTGPDSVLVPHEQGVTIFAPESGQITQTGTTTGDITIGERQLMADATGVGTALAAAEQAPRDLVPVAVPATNTVIVLAGQKILTIDTSRYDCPEPSHPAVFRDEVYVPCRNGKVVAFNRGGGYVTVIPTGNDRRPVLVLDEGRLFVNTAGARSVGLYIDTEGAVVVLGVIPDDLLPQEPADPPAVVIDPESPSDPADNDRSGDRGNPDDDSAADDPTPTDAGSGTSAGSPSAPTNASATATTDGRIVVTWQHAGPADRFEVLRTNPSTVVAVVDDGRATQATVTVVPAGTTTSYVVRAHLGTQSADSRPTSAVTAMGPPSAPGSVTIEVQSDYGASLNVTVRWAQASANGTPVTGYAVELRPSHDAAQTQPALASAGAANFTFACGTTCVNAPVVVEARVTASSASGDGLTATGSFSYGGSRPVDGDPVVGALDSQPYQADAVCPPPTVTLTCRGHFTYYTIALTPPPMWVTFPGSCSLIVEGSGPLARTQSLPSCGPRDVGLGDGDGNSYLVSVRACDALGCASSAARSTGTLNEPYYEPLCGEFIC